LALPVPGVEKSPDEGMKQGKTRLFCVGENLLSVEVVLVALFWVSEPVTETLALDKGNLLRMLLPAQPEQAWDRGYSRSWYLSLLATCGGAYARSARG
jgi:hypothetical protein